MKRMRKILGGVALIVFFCSVAASSARAAGCILEIVTFGDPGCGSGSAGCGTQRSVPPKGAPPA